MANVPVSIIKSGVTNNKPTTAQISIGQLAINYKDQILYSTDGSSVFQIGANVSSNSFYSANINLSPTAGIVANNTIGFPGQILTSNGSSVFWSTQADETCGFFDTKTLAINTVVSSKIKTLVLNGYTSVGDAGFGATYTSITNPGTLQPWHLTTDSGTRFWKLSNKEITPGFFGAVGDGIVDDAASVQNFLTARVNNIGNSGFWQGDYLINTPLVYGITPSNTTRLVGQTMRGTMHLIAGTSMTQMLTIQGHRNLTINGGVHCTGTGSYTYVSKTVTHGVVIRAVTYTNCTFIKGEYLLGYALADDGKDYVNDLNNFGTVSGQYSGSGVAGSENSGAYSSWSLQANYSGRVDTGADVSSLSTFVVTSLPPQSLEFASARPIPMYAMLSGDPANIYQVSAIDRVNSKISIFPFPDNAVLTGSLTYFFGGPYLTSGGDSNINTIQSLDAVACGIGAVEAGIYGTKILQFHSNSCGVAYAFGSSLVSAMLGVNILDMYCENNTWDIIKNSIAAPPSASGNINVSVMQSNLSKIKVFGAYRTSNVLYSQLVSMSGILFTYAGQSFATEARSLNIDDTYYSTYQSGVMLPMDWRGPPKTLRCDVGYVTIVASATNNNSLFGIDSQQVIFIGTNAALNYAPTSVTFTPPTGATINGGSVSANATFTGFFGPAEFLIKYIVATNNYIIVLASFASGFASSVAVLNLPANSKTYEYSQKVTDVRVNPNSLITLSLGSMLDTDENDSEMLDMVALAARPATGSFDIVITFSSPQSGPVPIIYKIG